MARLDRARILAKIDELDSQLEELKDIAPKSFKEYQRTEKRRACERLLQISIESVIDVCNLFVSGLRLGLPAEEDDLFSKLLQAHVISKNTREILREMKGFRNILVHEYTHVDDRLVYKAVKEKIGDFDTFRSDILSSLKALDTG